jgi:hypothetical protein
VRRSGSGRVHLLEVKQGAVQIVGIQSEQVAIQRRKVVVVALDRPRGIAHQGDHASRRVDGDEGFGGGVLAACRVEAADAYRTPFSDARPSTK